jgi:hypothetical protein
MVYPGGRDWWIIGLLSVVTAALLVGGGTLVGVAFVAGPYFQLLPGAMLLAVGSTLLWVIFGTNYEIIESSLILRSGPFRWTIPLDAIEEVAPAGWLGGPAIKMNLALSVRGLRVRYWTRSGRLSWPIRIAPRDRAAFLLELAERLPWLDVKDDGSQRRPPG